MSREHGWGMLTAVAIILIAGVFVAALGTEPNIGLLAGPLIYGLWEVLFDG